MTTDELIALLRLEVSARGHEIAKLSHRIHKARVRSRRVHTLLAEGLAIIRVRNQTIEDLERVILGQGIQIDRLKQQTEKLRAKTDVELLMECDRQRKVIVAMGAEVARLNQVCSSYAHALCTDERPAQTIIERLEPHDTD